MVWERLAQDIGLIWSQPEMFLLLLLFSIFYQYLNNSWRSKGYIAATLSFNSSSVSWGTMIPGQSESGQKQQVTFWQVTNLHVHCQALRLSAQKTSKWMLLFTSQTVNVIIGRWRTPRNTEDEHGSPLHFQFHTWTRDLETAENLPTLPPTVSHHRTVHFFPCFDAAESTFFSIETATTEAHMMTKSRSQKKIKKWSDLEWLITTISWSASASHKTVKPLTRVMM